MPAWLIHAARAIETWPNSFGGVPEFVRLAGRSHEHVSRDCRRLMQTTPRELVSQARLKWASMQLETSQKEIIDIAQECGFENLGHFYKLFKAEYQNTPRQYRMKFGIPQYP
jgi:AraC family cel operon transcriptional repressor